MKYLLFMKTENWELYDISDFKFSRKQKQILIQDYCNETDLIKKHKANINKSNNCLINTSNEWGKWTEGEITDFIAR